MAQDGSLVGLSRFSPAERRQAILDAARSVFAESGLAGARTKVIAERAGVAEGLVFKYFDTKDRLFELAVVNVLEDLVNQVEADALEFASSPRRERVERARRFHAETAPRMREIVPLLGAVMFDQKHASESFYLRVLGPSLARVADALAGTVDKVPNRVDPRMLTMVIFGSHFFTALDAYHRSEELDPERIADDLLALLERGLAG